MTETKAQTRPTEWGKDYDGWALPCPGKGAPRWSHFVASPGKPRLPKGCVRVKLFSVGPKVPVDTRE